LHNVDVRHGLRFGCTVASVPIRVLDRLRARLRAVSETLWAASPGSSFWTSLMDNPLTLDVAGWRFQYTISREPRQIDVLDAMRISDVLPALDDAVRRQRGA
jgi:hypothetical protein